jgi:hypothetical protein
VRTRSEGNCSKFRARASVGVTGDVAATQQIIGQDRRGSVITEAAIIPRSRSWSAGHVRRIRVSPLSL